MKFEAMKKAASMKINRVGLVLDKYSPEILLGVGLASLAGATVMACRQTLKVSDVKDYIAENKKTIDEMKDYIAAGVITEDKYSEQDRLRDITIVYTQATVQVAKLYAPAIILGALGTTCILGGFGILKKRYIGVAAALSLTEKSFKDYRQRVVDLFGEEVDYKIKNNVRTEEIVSKVINENGEEEEVVETVTSSEPSMYARFFDEASSFWRPDPNYNFSFIKSQEIYANDMLKSRGHVFLNEVYDLLDIPRTSAGQVVGWVLDTETGDGYIDFGIFTRGCDFALRRFVNGYETNVLLDFNVDGCIHELI